MRYISVCRVVSSHVVCEIEVVDFDEVWARCRSCVADGATGVCVDMGRVPVLSRWLPFSIVDGHFEYKWGSYIALQNSSRDVERFECDTIGVVILFLSTS